MPPNLKFSLIPDLQADKCPSGCLQGTNAHVILAQKPSALQKQTVTALSWSRVRHWCHVRVHSFLHTVLKPLTSGEALLQRPSLDGSFPAPDWSPAMHLLLQAHCLSCISWPPAFSIFYFLATYVFKSVLVPCNEIWVVLCLNENQVVKMSIRHCKATGQEQACARESWHCGFSYVSKISSMCTVAGACVCRQVLW